MDAPPYPRHWEADAVLGDGGTVHLRPITPDDADRLRAFHSRLSPDTIYNRFFTMVRTLPARDVERRELRAAANYGLAAGVYLLASRLAARLAR